LWLQCVNCKHHGDLSARPATCEAFPDGIPEEIYHPELGHTKVCEGANGIRLNPIDVGFSQMAVPHPAREQAFAYWLGRYQRLLGYTQPSFDFERSNEKWRAWWRGYQDGENGNPVPDEYKA